MIFHAIFEQLCQASHLQAAWEQVERKGSGGGIDRVKVQDFAAHSQVYLAELRTSLIHQTYIPEPYLEIKIPKGDGTFRTLGLPTVRDKIVQQAVKNLLAPGFEQIFLDVSYGYRQNKGPFKAVQRVRHLIQNERKYWFVNLDIQQYFDNIPHDRLMEVLGRYIADKPLLNLIEMWIKMAKVTPNGDWRAVTKGIPQGALLSPLISNVYLHALDKRAITHNYGYVRYADDFILLADSQEKARQALADFSHYLPQTLGLTLHEGAQVQRVESGFAFLGLWFQGSELSLPEDRKQEIRANIQDVSLNQHQMLSEAYLSSLTFMRGYYGKLLPQHYLEMMDEWLMNAIIGHYRAKRKEQKSLGKDIKQPSAKWQLGQKVSQTPFAPRDALYAPTVDTFKHLLFFSRAFIQARIEKIKIIIKEIRARVPEEKSEATQVVASVAEKVASRRKDYEKKEKGIEELVIWQSGVYIGKTKGKVCVKRDRKTIAEIPMQRLKHITLSGRNFSLSSDFLYACKQQKIAIHYIDFDGSEVMQLLPPYNLSFERVQKQMESYHNGRAHHIALQIVKGKIKNQINLIKYFYKYHATQVVAGVAESALQEMEAGVEAWSQLEATSSKLQIQKDPLGTLSTLRAQLFALEGRVAEQYWRVVKELLAGYISFEGRERQGAQDPFNMMLNYGYGILYARLRQMLQKRGVQEGFSYLHVPAQAPHQPTLVYDIIELFRAQAVDRPLIAWIRKENPTIDKTGTQLSEATRKKIYERVKERWEREETYRGEKHSLYAIMELQIESMLACMDEKANNFLPYLAKW